MYQSKSAQMLRAVTSKSPVVWSPDTGWTDADRDREVVFVDDDPIGDETPGGYDATDAYK